MYSRRVFVRALIILVFAAVAGPVCADFGAGVAAYKRGDFERAHVLFEPLAEADDARAQFALGLLYDNGEGVPQDVAAAFDWYGKSAAQGYAKAQYNLALMLESGRIGAASDARARFARAALKGNADAVTRLHEYAAAQDTAAALQLGRMYALGKGVARSPRDAYGWFDKAAGAGDLDAAFALGVLHEKGEGVAQSYAEAVRWYARAAQGGQSRAQFNLARLYRLGRGVGRDPERARALYESAATAGLASAQLSLAMLFEAGQEWPHDPAAAFAWYQRAARNGSADAQLNLAFLYAQGVGVARDVLEACALLRVAAERGLSAARDNQALLCADLEPTALSQVEERAGGYRATPQVPVAQLSARD
jgi:uncharacterized protein